MTTYVVSSTSELTTILSNARGGDKIELRAGDYGDLKLGHLDFTSEVTITAHDADPPIFNSIALWNCDNLTFDGINVDFEPTAETVEWSAGFRADGSSDIKILNSTFTGGNAVAGIDADAEAGLQGKNGINGYPIGVGVSFYRSTDVTVENNTISQFSSGVRFNNTYGVDMNYNEIHSVRKVPVGGGDVNNVHMEGNYFHDMTPWKFGGKGDHGDFVHFWTSPTQGPPSENFVFRGNFFAQGDGVPVLGIYLDDNLNDIGFRNVLVENNVIHNSNAQGVRMEDVVGLTIINNTMVQASGADIRDAPGIHLSEGTRDVTISGNIHAGISGPGAQNPERDNITVGNNMIVQIQDPLAENYVGKLFVNAMTTSPTLADLSVVPGSILDGFGAAITNMPGGYISNSWGEGLAMATHDFDLSMDRAGNVTWDFGDGTTAEGKTAQHTFAKPGTYTATATVQYEDGTSQTFTKTVHTLSPVGLQSGFEDGVQSGMTIRGDAEFVAGQNGDAVRLTSPRSTVTFDATEDLLNNPEFTISLAFRKDAGHETEGGRLLYFSGTAIVDLTATGIVVRGSTDAGETIRLGVNEAGLDDSDWHQFTYTTSKADGTAILYLDGVEIARMEGLTGGQYTTLGHDMHIGNPFGQSLSGLMDEATFLRAALTPEQVQESYAAFRDGTTMLDYEPQPPVFAQPDPDQDIPSTEDTEEEAMDMIVAAPPVDILPEKPVSGSGILSYTAQDGLTTFENGYAFVTDLKGAVTSEGITLGGKGTATQIDRVHVTDILGQDAFSFSLTLTSGSTQSAGEIMRLHSSFITTVTSKGELNVYLCGENGDRKSLTTQGANLSDMAAHDINISLANGTLKIKVDGNTLVTAENIEPLADVGRHNLTFGNPWNGKNFDGILSKLSISLDDDGAQPMAMPDAIAAPMAFDTWTPLPADGSLDGASRFENMLTTAQDDYFL